MPRQKGQGGGRRRPPTRGRPREPETQADTQDNTQPPAQPPAPPRTSPAWLAAHFENVARRPQQTSERAGYETVRVVAAVAPAPAPARRIPRRSPARRATPAPAPARSPARRTPRNSPQRRRTPRTPASPPPPLPQPRGTPRVPPTPGLDAPMRATAERLVAEQRAAEAAEEAEDEEWLFSPAAPGHAPSPAQLPRPRLADRAPARGARARADGRALAALAHGAAGSGRAVGATAARRVVGGDAEAGRSVVAVARGATRREAVGQDEAPGHHDDAARVQACSGLDRLRRVPPGRQIRHFLQ